MAGYVGANLAAERSAHARVKWSYNMQTGKASYWVEDNPQLRAIVRSSRQETPACTVELGWDKLYDTFDDALAASMVMCSRRITVRIRQISICWMNRIFAIDHLPITLGMTSMRRISPMRGNSGMVSSFRAPTVR